MSDSTIHPGDLNKPPDVLMLPAAAITTGISPDIRVGVYGESRSNVGVYGASTDGSGVKAVSKHGAGLTTASEGNVALHAETTSPRNAAIAAYNRNPQGDGAALFAHKEGTLGHAGFFVGNVHITGQLTIDAISIASLIGRIQHLEQTVHTLQQKAGPPAPGGGTARAVLLSAERIVDPATPYDAIKVTGSGFDAAESVSLRMDYRAPGASEYSSLNAIRLTADTRGSVEHTFAITCGGASPASWRLQAISQTSDKQSDIKEVRC